MFALRRPIRSLDPLLSRAILRVLSDWRVGSLGVRFPDGTTAEVGAPAAEERAWLTIHDESVFARVLLGGETAAAETWTEGLWDTPDLAALLHLYAKNRASLRLGRVIPWLGRLPALVRRELRRNSRAGSIRNVQAHYDLGNDFYRLFLDDEAMAYSCALWAPGDTLEDAQRRKMDRICDLLELGPGDRLLEIGCGWGGLAIHAARTRGCTVTGVTISRAQLELARARVAAAGLADRVTIEHRDYRDLSGTFDKLASIEMFEAVGDSYWDDYFRACARALRPGGLKVLQTIVVPDERFAAYRRETDWSRKHVFPGTVIPSVAAMTPAMARAGLRVESIDRIGAHYAPTLRAWRERFLARRAEARRLGKDERFLRTWELYLAFAETSFTYGTVDDVHVLLKA